MTTNLATLQITSVTGVCLTAIHLPPGTWAGYPSTVSDERKVEFYDTRYDHTIFGQFTGGRYYVSTLLEDDRPSHGLALDGDIRDWIISATELERVKTWLREF